eukprot:TRINITY_DN21379_c0_g1_i2.p2 TRINITY_DN21379_c0_g1~~TRINITY_DN21379_c0_g1_i2.p2  ORF type:complete len:189 (-),score=-1.83 TRINITY_DN21379_c0_g1_i2:169-735(-)
MASVSTDYTTQQHSNVKNTNSLIEYITREEQPCIHFYLLFIRLKTCSPLHYQELKWVVVVNGYRGVFIPNSKDGGGDVYLGTSPQIPQIAYLGVSQKIKWGQLSQNKKLSVILSESNKQLFFCKKIYLQCAQYNYLKKLNKFLTEYTIESISLCIQKLIQLSQQIKLLELQAIKLSKETYTSYFPTQN